MKSRFWILTAAVIAGALIVSCNGDDGGGGYRPPPGPVTLDVKAGTWNTVGKLTAQTPGCLKIADIKQTQVYCDGIDVTQQAKNFGMDCTFTVNGDQVQGTCAGTLTGSITYTGSVSGGAGSGGRTMSLGGTLNLLMGEGEDAQECRYAVVIDGVWESSAGCGSSAPGEVQPR